MQMRIRTFTSQMFSSKIRERRIGVAGHFVRDKEEEEASKVVLWQPQLGQTKRGRPKTTYIHTFGLKTPGSPLTENSER